MINEEWKPVKGYEGRYEVSNLGRVRSLKRATTNGVVLKQTIKHGYMHVCLSKENKPSTKRVHRLVAEAFIANPMGKPVVNHIDGDKTNNAASNLEWATNSENELHSFRVLGKKPNIPWKGKPRKFARKLSYADAVAIIDSKRPSRELAAEFGVSKTTILNIRKRKIYREVCHEH